VVELHALAGRQRARHGIGVDASTPMILVSGRRRLM
jgi:hypothetical protein